MRLALFLALFSVTGACDSPGGRGQALIPDGDTSVASTGDTHETAPETLADSEAAPEVTPEVIEDTTPPSVCALGCIPVDAASGALGVMFQQFDFSPRPALMGGGAPQGDWDLVEIDVFAQGTFAEGIEVSFANHGSTRGRASFGGDAMAMSLDLDMDITVTAFGSTSSSSGASAIELGGCHEARDGKLVGPLATCTPGGPPNPEEGSLDYELGSDLQVGVELTREQLIALLPPDQQEAASWAIVGPLYLVALFERP